MDRTDKALYLTFDDGPVPGPTEFVLDTLQPYDIKATFFCIGDNVCKYPDIFARLKEAGHAIGNHTVHHVKGWQTSAEVYKQEVDQCQTILKQATNQNLLPLFRPPYGRITRKQIRSLKGYRIVMWDVLSVDYNQHLSREACFRNTKKAVRPGSIIVFHDSLKAQRNMTFTLPRLIDWALGSGYTFKTI